MIHEKLVIGIDEHSPIEELLAMGIRQFYAGYIPVQWLEKYHSQQSLNRRYLQKEQFYDPCKLQSAAERIHNGGGTLSIALNAPFQTPQMLPYSLEIADIARKIHADALIIGNITLLELLKDCGIPITLSTTLCIYSQESVEFFVSRYHPKRVIFPRDMMLSEIEAIVSAMPEVEFEVFLYGDTCRWSDGYCFVEHGYDSIDKGLPFCVHLKNTYTPFSKPNPQFKQIISSQSPEEALPLLKSSIITPQALLDALEVALDEGDESQIAKTLHFWQKYNFTAELSINQALLVRSKRLLEAIPKKVIHSKLYSLNPEILDSKAVFSKTDLATIIGTKKSEKSTQVVERVRYAKRR